MAVVATAASLYASPARPGQALELAGARLTPAPGKTVHVGSVRREDGRTVIQGLQAETLSVGATAHDMTFKDVAIRNFKIVSSGTQAPRNISIVGGSVGPSRDDNNLIASDGTTTTASPTNIVIDGVTIHDFTLTPGSDAHVECLQVWAADGLTIRNSTFRNCEVFDVFLQKLPGGQGPTPHGITIENNFMDCCRSGYFSIRLANHEGTSWRDVTIRNNSTDKAINPDPSVPYANVQITSNIGPALDTGGSALPAGIRADYNVWYSGRKIGAHDQVAPSGFVNAGAVDFHLKEGAAAVDRGDPGSFPATDFDYQARPSGAAPDAGADERSTAPPVTGPGGTPPAPGGPSPAPPQALRTLRFAPVADAALRRSAPRKPGGRAKRLRVARGHDALLKFRVRGVGAGRVTSARMRLWVASGRARRLTVRRTSTRWRESRTSWRRAPRGRARLATLRRVKGHRYVTVALPTAVGGDGRFGVRLSSSARRGVLIASRAGGRHAPRLELKVAGP